MSSDAPGRSLAVDHGARRSGLALSDDMGWGARPLEVCEGGDAAVIDRIRTLVAEHEVRRLVVGVPYRDDGSVGTQAEAALAFVELLRTALPSLELVTRDEGHTSEEADRAMTARGIKDPKQRKRWRDAYAAAVILQEDLDARG